jgi:hypothetical protein
VRATERVVAAEFGVVWDGNTEHGVLITSETGEARLRLHARPGEPGQRRVTFAWHGVKAARMEPPNDEAIEGHRLYGAGLRDIVWIGEVLDSSLIADLERRNRVHARHDLRRFEGLRHWVLPLKGSVVEVVAESCEVIREEPAAAGAEL